jgi:hypothetical protein
MPLLGQVGPVPNDTAIASSSSQAATVLTFFFAGYCSHLYTATSTDFIYALFGAEAFYF